MIENSESAWRSEPDSQSPSEPRPSGWSSLGVLAALVGIAVLVGVVDLLAQGENPSVAAAMASWNWVVNVVLVILAIVIILLVIRIVFRGLGMTPREPRERRHRRYDAAAARDPAVDIARSRFARGEISQDQLDQTLRQLGKSS